MTEPLFWIQGLIGGLGLVEVLAAVRTGRSWA
jgi:hypothetical protein